MPTGSCPPDSLPRPPQPRSCSQQMRPWDMEELSASPARPGTCRGAAGTLSLTHPSRLSWLTPLLDSLAWAGPECPLLLSSQLRPSLRRPAPLPPAPILPRPCEGKGPRFRSCSLQSTAAPCNMAAAGGGRAKPEKASIYKVPSSLHPGGWAWALPPSLVRVPRGPGPPGEGRPRGPQASRRRLRGSWQARRGSWQRKPDQFFPDVRDTRLLLQPGEDSPPAREAGCPRGSGPASPPGGSHLQGWEHQPQGPLCFLVNMATWLPRDRLGSSREQTTGQGRTPDRTARPAQTSSTSSGSGRGLEASGATSQGHRPHRCSVRTTGSLPVVSSTCQALPGAVPAVQDGGRATPRACRPFPRAAGERPTPTAGPALPSPSLPASQWRGLVPVPASLAQTDRQLPEVPAGRPSPLSPLPQAGGIRGNWPPLERKGSYPSPGLPD